MDRTTLVRTGIAGAVAGLGLTAGGVAMATADDQAPDTTSSTARPDGHGGPRGERAGDSKALAEALGLDETVVATAVKKVRDAQRPTKPAEGTTPTPPTEAERATRQAAFITALAKELKVDEAKVRTAVEALAKKADAAREERRTESRADLVKRLDAAVTAGTLTAADKASVLKAFDAKIIGDGPGGPGGRGPAPKASTS